MVAPPEEVFAMTRSVADTPDAPEEIEISFEGGNPVAINGQRLDPVALIREANRLAGTHGIGRLDMIENRVVGIKSREIYETPGLLLLIQAHQELESPLALMLRKRQLRCGRSGIRPLVRSARDALDGFMDRTQVHVNGVVRLRLHKVTATVIGRASAESSLYVPAMASYGSEDQFDHRAAEGFIYVWGLPTRLWAATHRG